MPRMPASPAVRFVVPRYGTGIVGGSENLVRRLAHALTARGWKVEVWSTTAVEEATWAGDLPLAEREGEVQVRRFPVARLRHPRAFHQFSRAMFRLPAAIRPEGAWIRAQGPYSPQLVRALAVAEPIPAVFTPYLFHPTVFGLPAAAHPRILMPAAHDERPLGLRSVGRTIAAADALWYHSEDEQALVESRHPEALRIPFAVGTVGVEAASAADPGRFRAGHGIEEPYLLYGGRAATGKGVEMLLDGFAALRRTRADVRLVVAGERGAAIDASPRGVVFAGRLDDSDWADVIAGAAAVVVPSRFESLSLLMLEAWAARRPVLANAASPVLRGLAERSGGAVMFTTADELAGAALRVLDDAQLADRLGAAGSAYVAANYRWDDVVARLSRLIQAAGGAAT
jgi:glycosyltransferase involved in cell wall biosynthesis